MTSRERRRKQSVGIFEKLCGHVFRRPGPTGQKAASKPDTPAQRGDGVPPGRGSRVRGEGTFLPGRLRREPRLFPEAPRACTPAAELRTGTATTVLPPSRAQRHLQARLEPRPLVGIGPPCSSCSAFKSVTMPGSWQDLSFPT